MEEIVKKDFKEELSQLAKSIGTPTPIPTLPEFQIKAKGWGWIGAEHKVSGAEMNNFIVALDNLLAQKNDWETKAYNEIKSIYETLDALDKEYINGFMGTFKVVKTASENSTNAIITLKERIATQQDSIADLDTIRTNAQKGATAVQPEDLKSYVKTDDSRLTDARPASDIYPWAKGKQKPSYTADEVGALSKDTKISEIDGFSEEHQRLENKQDKINDLEKIRFGATLGATAIQKHQDISGKQDVIADLDSIRNGAALGATAIQKHQDISGKADISFVEKQLQCTKDNLSQEVTTLQQTLQKTQEDLQKEQQEHIKLKRSLIATSICIGTISIGALIALLILIL